jgi:superfamily I DNA and/or RNA helicase
MHGDISRIPRKFIYDDRALKDDTRTYASFQYINNKPRFEIRNVVCENIERNKNEEEAKAIVQELDLYFNSSPIKGTKIAILTFYNGQVYYLRQLLQRYFGSNSKYSFKKNGIEVSLNTVDKFQGQEADVVYLSMVQNYRVGFLDSVNRMNVAITRAKDKLIIFGNKKFFQDQNDSELLKNIFKEVN